MTNEVKVLIERIGQRAFHELGVKSSAMVVESLSIVHTNGCPMDLQRLYDASYSTFGHDVFGILRYLDSETGQLTDCFLPRCALPE